MWSAPRGLTCCRLRGGIQVGGGIQCYVLTCISMGPRLVLGAAAMTVSSLATTRSGCNSEISDIWQKVARIQHGTRRTQSRESSPIPRDGLVCGCGNPCILRLGGGNPTVVASFGRYRARRQFRSDGESSDESSRLYGGRRRSNTALHAAATGGFSVCGRAPGSHRPAG